MATTKTLPDGSVVTLPAYNEAADIQVINNGLSNICDNITSLNTNKVTSRNGNANSPELSGVKITGQENNVDVIQFGGGQEFGTSGNAGGILYSHGGRRYTFRSKAANNTNYEQFNLPAIDTSRTTDVSYDILTSKDFPFFRDRVESTGVSGSNKVTFSSHGTTRHALIGYAGNIGFVYHTGDTGSTIYTDIPTGKSSGWSWDISKNGTTYTIERSADTKFYVNILWF